MPIIKQQELFVPMFAGGGSRGGYTAVPANFDGATYLSRGADLTGVSDSKVCSGSLWTRVTGAPTFARIFNTTNDRYALLFGSGGLGAGVSLGFFGSSAAGAGILRKDITTDEFPEDNEWHHICWSFNMANAAERSVVIDGVAASDTYTTYTDAAIDFTDTDIGIGANPSGANPIAADVADVWLRFGGDWIDFSVEANLRLFIDANGKPANPTGWPSGGQVQLYGSVDDWHTNKGSGEGFTETGALTDGLPPVQLGHPTVADAEAVIEELAPIAWFKFDDGSGDTLTDYSGNGYHGTRGAAGAAPTWSAEGLSFDGGDYVLCPAIAPSGDNITVVVVYKTGYSAGGNFMLCSGDIQAGVDTFAWLLGLGQGDGSSWRVDVSDDGDQDDAATTRLTEDTAPAYNDDAWRDLAFTYDGTTDKMYVAGAEITPDTNTGTSSGLFQTTDETVIGGLLINGAVSLQYTGDIAYLLIFEAALSAADVAEVHNALAVIMADRSVTLP